MSLQTIIQNGQAYMNQFNQANERLPLWPQVSGIITTRLNHIKATLEKEVPYFTKNLTVKNTGEFEVSLFSGPMAYSNGVDEKGFYIRFKRTATGKIDVWLSHHTVGEHGAQNDHLRRFDNPLDIEEKLIDEVVAIGIEKAQNSSYLFAD